MPVLCHQKPPGHFALSLDGRPVSPDALHPLPTVLGAPFPMPSPCSSSPSSCPLPNPLHRICISVFLAWPLIVAWWCFPGEFGCSLPLKYQRASAPLIVTGTCSSSSGLCETGGRGKNQKPVSKPLEL